MLIGLLRLSEYEKASHESVHDVILSFYYLALSVLIVLSQLPSMTDIQHNMRFLNYHWGRAQLCFFLGAISFSNHSKSLIQYATGAYFILAATIFLAFSLYDRKHDKERDRQDDITALNY